MHGEGEAGRHGIKLSSRVGPKEGIKTSIRYGTLATLNNLTNQFYAQNKLLPYTYVMLE